MSSVPVTGKMSGPGQPEPKKPAATHTLKGGKISPIVKKYTEYMIALEDGFDTLGSVAWAFVCGPLLIILMIAVILILGPSSGCSTSSSLNPPPAWSSSSDDSRAYAGETKEGYEKRMQERHHPKPDTIISAPVDTRILGWIAGGCAALSVVALVASFTPLGATVPRGLAAGLALGSVGAWALQYTLNVYGKPLFISVAICTIITVMAVAIIFGITAIRWALRRTGLQELHSNAPVENQTARDWVLALAASDNRVNKIRSELADALDKFLAKAENADRALGLLKSVGISPPKWLVN